MTDGGMTRLDKALTSVDFFAKIRILAQKEAKAIKQYLLGEGMLINKTDDFEIDESECPIK